MNESIGVKNPRIIIDHKKCTTPFDCKKCLQLCTHACFNVRVMKMQRGREVDKKQPGSFKLFFTYRDKCTGCKECVDACPVGALNMTI